MELGSMDIRGLGSYGGFYPANSGDVSPGSGAFDGARPSSAPPAGEQAEKGQSTGRSASSDRVSLSPEAQALLKELKSRDQEVRAHEQAHMAAGGGLTGGATYSFETGPDGKQYAVGGEVSIDSSPVPGNPLATVNKMQVVKRAALAPARPSGQDMKVAARAGERIAQAQQALAAGGGQRARSYTESSSPDVSRSTGQNVGLVV